MLSSITPSIFGQNFLHYFLAKFPSMTSINNAIIRNKKLKVYLHLILKLLKKNSLKYQIPVNKCTRYALITLIFRFDIFSLF